jgi:hypothetical protein
LANNDVPLLQVAVYLEAETQTWASCFWDAAGQVSGLDLSYPGINEAADSELQGASEEVIAAICDAWPLMNQAIPLADKLRATPRVAYTAVCRTCLQPSDAGPCLALDVAKLPSSSDGYPSFVPELPRAGAQALCLQICGTRQQMKAAIARAMALLREMQDTLGANALPVKQLEISGKFHDLAQLRQLPLLLHQVATCCTALSSQVTP